MDWSDSRQTDWETVLHQCSHGGPTDSDRQIGRRIGRQTGRQADSSHNENALLMHVMATMDLNSGHQIGK